MMTSILPFADCGGPFDLAPGQTMPSWDSMPTTLAEMAVIAYLEQRPEQYVGKSLLHVGIGNSSLFATLGRKLEKFVGLTISLPEQQFFQQRFADANATKIILANKHDPRAYSQIDKELDLIVDVNLKSFACCEKHFDQLMALYAQRLARGVVIITALSGIVFGWGGKTRAAHTPGACLDPSDRDNRILGKSGLVQISA
jgi:hypothetical protein